MGLLQTVLKNPCAPGTLPMAFWDVPYSAAFYSVAHM